MHFEKEKESSLWWPKTSRKLAYHHQVCVAGRWIVTQRRTRLLSWETNSLAEYHWMRSVYDHNESILVYSLKIYGLKK